MIGTQKQILEYLQDKSDANQLYELKEIKSGKKQRSIYQNKYYWWVLIEIIADYMGIKYPYEKMELHMQLKDQFWVKTTTDLDTAEFSFLVNEIRAWFLEHRNLYIPEPDEEENLASLDKYLN